MLNQQSFIMEAAHHGSLPGKKSVVLPPSPVAAVRVLAFAARATRGKGGFGGYPNHLWIGLHPLNEVLPFDWTNVANSSLALAN